MSATSRHGRAGDVRGFYAHLGVALPARAGREAPVRCFAEPAAHRRDDRTPSCSVNLTSGAFCCHSCGASGGAYDAALALGLTPRSAIDLMVDHGLTERRARRSDPVRPRATARPTTAAPAAVAPTPSELGVSDDELNRWCGRLLRDRALLERLSETRGWDADVLRRHCVGCDGDRITIPVRRDGHLVGLVRYAPLWRRQGPKVVARSGSRHALFPDPATIPGETIWIVEGQPDALAALSAGIPATAVAGVRAWRPEWATGFVDRTVVVCMDCDDAGRAAAKRIADDLRAAAVEVRIVDLEPGRRDGYDLTDALLAGRRVEEFDDPALSSSRPETGSLVSRDPPVPGAARFHQNGGRRSVAWSCAACCSCCPS